MLFAIVSPAKTEGFVGVLLSAVETLLLREGLPLESLLFFFRVDFLRFFFLGVLLSSFFIFGFFLFFQFLFGKLGCRNITFLGSILPPSYWFPNKSRE